MLRRSCRSTSAQEWWRGGTPPAAVKAVAKLAEALPSRDAEVLAKALDVLPFSRASQQRAGLDIGARWDTLHAAAEPQIT